jgi:hypothetical protein
MLYMPYLPTILLALPLCYFFSSPTNPLYLQSCNMMQYYVSGVLCFNTFFVKGSL